VVASAVSRPDPIENLWAILNNEATDKQPQNDEALFAALKTAWYN